MASRFMRFCKPCGEYVLGNTCSKCGTSTIDPSPSRFSPEDRYGAYRRKMKILMANEGGD